MVYNEKDIGGCVSSWPISQTARDQIASAFWDFDGTNKIGDKRHKLDEYFKYYTVQCDLALHDVGRHATIRTHQDVVQIVGYLRQGCNKDEIAKQLQPELITEGIENREKAIENSIDLACRLLSMIEIGCIDHGFSGRDQLHWSKGSMQQFVHGVFQPDDHKLDHVKLERTFIARNLPRVARINLVWTDNLVDHLRLMEDDTQVAIFHHASFLTLAKQRFAPVHIVDS